MKTLEFKTAILDCLVKSAVKIFSGNNIVGEIKNKIELNMPVKEEYGDLSTNIALILAKSCDFGPMELAKKLTEEFKSSAGSDILEYCRNIKVEKPGFINFYISDVLKNKWLNNIFDFSFFNELKIQKDKKKVSVEFVSANPTGPLTVAHARQAVFGDSLANIYEFCGYDVTRQYYVNDEGRQIELLGESVYQRCLELMGLEFNFPEDGYKGEYVNKIAENFLESNDKDKVKNNIYPEEIYINFAVAYLMDKIKNELNHLGVNFNSWPKQSSITESRRIEGLFDKWKKNGYAYEKDGALWFKSTALGDSKDRVLIKKDGKYTYFSPDILLHQDKLKDNDLVIDVWGPDHHGYIPRMKAAVKAMGYDDKKIKILIVQLTTVYSKGKPLSMSKREGEFVSLKDILDSVGKDASRIFLLMRKSDSHLDFDLQLAKKHSMDNPVYYIQYAHARIHSILEKADLAGISSSSFKDLKPCDLLNLECVPEKQILNKLMFFLDEILIALNISEPFRLLNYLQDLSGLFHRYYAQEKIINEDEKLTLSRLYLSKSVMNVLKTGLMLLGVDAPDSM